MFMTDEQKYSAVLKELGEVLQNKNTTISCQRWQIDELTAKLTAAENERDCALHELEVAEKRLAQAHAKIDALKGGAA